MSALERHPVTYTETAIPQPLSDGDGDSLNNDIVLSNGENNLVLRLTAAQYTDLLSAALNGAVRSFPERYIEVIYPLIKAGKLAFCDEVNDCVETNVTLQQTINNILIQSGQLNPNTIDPDNTTGTERIPDADTASVSPPPPACDKDALWAGIRSMVERMDANGRDILEDLSVINDKIEQVAEIIDLVPLLGDTIKDISDLFTETVPDLLNAYNAASSPTFLDNVACDLFELVCQECRYPTYDEVFSYLVGKSALALPASLLAVTYGSVWSVVKAVSVLTPELVWYSLNVWQCVTLAFDGYFNRSYGKQTFEIWCSFGEDNPSDNWEILCDGCEDTWCYSMDLTPFTHFDFSGTGGFQAAGVLNGTQWDASVVAGGLNQVRAIGVESAVFGFDTALTKVEMDYDAIFGGGIGQKYPARIRLMLNDVVAWDSAANDPATEVGLDKTKAFQTNLSQSLYDQIQILQVVDNSTGISSTGSGSIKAVRLYGTGTNPFGASNC